MFKSILFVFLISTSAAYSQDMEYGDCIESATLDEIMMGSCDMYRPATEPNCEDTADGFSCKLVFQEDTPGFYLLESIFYSATGDYGAAVVALDTAIVLDPRNTMIRAMLGYAQAQTGDIRGSMLTFQNALLIDIRDPEIYYQRALVKVQFGDSWGALNDLRVAIGIDNADHRFHLKRAVILGDSGQYSQAISAADRSVATSNEDCADCFFMAGALRVASDNSSETELGCRYLSRSGEMGNESSYVFINQYCR